MNRHKWIKNCHGNSLWDFCVKCGMTRMHLSYRNFSGNKVLNECLVSKQSVDAAHPHTLAYNQWQANCSKCNNSFALSWGTNESDDVYYRYTVHNGKLYKRVPQEKVGWTNFPEKIKKELITIHDGYQDQYYIEMFCELSDNEYKIKNVIL